MVARFVSCDFWNDKRAIVHNAIALFLQKAWRIRNAYKHGLADIDVADGAVPASMRRGADGIDARHEWYLYYYYKQHIVKMMFTFYACLRTQESRARIRATKSILIIMTDVE